MSDPVTGRPVQKQEVFDPPECLAAEANVPAGIYAKAAADRLGFWSEAARRLTWSAGFSEVLEWANPPFARWVARGKVKGAYTCVARPGDEGVGDRVAIHFVGEPGDRRDITYAQLKDE